MCIAFEGTRSIHIKFAVPDHFEIVECACCMRAEVDVWACVRSGDGSCVGCADDRERADGYNDRVHEKTRLGPESVYRNFIPSSSVERGRWLQPCPTPSVLIPTRLGPSTECMHCRLSSMIPGPEQSFHSPSTRSVRAVNASCELRAEARDSLGPQCHKPRVPGGRKR